ncbi:MAG TPA: hypothetical protein PLP01_03615 [Phycisphaerae bacterium]|nr:hypothetical protein [Phycisphaerae bacterium]
MIVKCPTCGKPLTVPDEAVGRKGKCPQCGTVFCAGSDQPRLAPAPIRPAPTAAPVAESAEARRAEDRSQMRGLLLLVAGIVVVGITALGCIMYGIEHMPSDPWEKASFKRNVRAVGTLPMLGGLALIGVGWGKMHSKKK